MTRRWNRVASIINGLASLLLLVNIVIFSYFLRHYDRAPGSDWGYTHERWYGILRSDAILSLTLAILATTIWFHPQIARLIDAILVIPKLWYSFVYLGFGSLSHNPMLLIAAILIFASALMIPLYWQSTRPSAI